MHGRKLLDSILARHGPRDCEERWLLRPEIFVELALGLWALPAAALRVGLAYEGGGDAAIIAAFSLLSNPGLPLLRDLGRAMRKQCGSSSDFLRKLDLLVKRRQSMQAWTVRAGIIAVCLGTFAILLASSGSSVGMGQTVDTQAASQQLQMVSTTLPSGIQQIVVIDSPNRSMAVYHIDPVQAKIQLKSVRKLAWDLNMEQFNALAPLPSELHGLQP